MASEEDNQHNDVVAIELPAPAGWSKKFSPKKGGTPQRNDIFFVSPTGEEIKSKRQLDQYLKSHPGEPSASEFDWGTGDTPRRSARLSEKSKAVVAPTSQSPKKKQKRSSTKGAQEKSNADAEEGATGEKDATAEETKDALETSTVDARDAADEDVIPGKPNSEDLVKKADTEESPAVVPVDTSANNLNASVEESNNATTGTTSADNLNASVEESNNGTGITSANNLNASVEESNNATTVVPDAKMEESKETSSVVPDSKADESKEAPHAKKIEAKEAMSAENETPDWKVDTAVTATKEGVENSKEIQAEEKEPLLQEPTTGS